MAAEELAGAGAADEFDGIDHGAAAQCSGAFSTGTARHRKSALISSTDSGIFPSSHHFSSPKRPPAMNCTMFHHLGAGQKEPTLREVRRVLAPGGPFHLLDLHIAGGFADNSFARRMHTSRHLKDNSETKILRLMKDAGFASSKMVADRALFFGLLRIGYYRASSSFGF